MNISCDKKDNSWFGVVLLVLYPILGQYFLESLPIALNDILILLYLLVSGLFRRRLCINKKIFLIGIFFASYNLLNGFINGDLQSSLNNSLSILLFFVVLSFIVSSYEPDLEKFYTVLKVASIASVVFLVYQLVSFYRGNIITGDISFLREFFVIENPGAYSSIYRGRPTSFFYEPAHFCIYIAPTLLLSLHFKDYLTAAIVAFGLIASTSSTGYAILLVVVCIYTMQMVKSKYKFLSLLLIPIAFIIIASWGSDLDKFSMASLANNIRVFKPLSYFSNFSLSEWFFGVGFNRLSVWGEVHGIAEVYNYANAILYMVLSFGMFGIVIDVMFIRWILIKDNFWRPFCIIVLFLLFSDQLLFNRNLGYLFICGYITKALNGNKLRNDYSCVQRRDL